MTRSSRCIVLAACLIAAGCSTGVDLHAERTALLETDRAWASTAAAGDVEQVFNFWADDAVVYPAGMPEVRGKQAIREFVTTNRAQPGFSIRWEPLEAVISQDATLGYTIGKYTFSITGPDGNPITRQGHYLETWRRNDDGQWQCTVEIQAPLTTPAGPDLRPDS